MQMPGISQTRGKMSQRPAGVLTCRRVLTVLMAWLPAAAADGSQSATVDGREALKAAVALVQQGKLVEADSHARRALADPDTRAVAYSVLGTIKLQRNKLDDSAKMLAEAIRLEPRLVGAQLTLAQVYTLQNKPALALARFRKVLELDPGNPSARLALARSELEKGNYQQALKRLTLSGPFCGLAFNLTRAYLMKKDAARALEHYDAALSLRPDSIDALRLAAGVAERREENGEHLGKKDEADRLLAHAKTLREEDDASSRLQLRLMDPDR
jgi:cytochrome c-type biogenesis protein CcmH/NrfG